MNPRTDVVVLAHVYRRTLCVTEKVQEIAGASKTNANIRATSGTLEADLLAVLILVKAARTLS